jgi:hypothetical protein
MLGINYLVQVSVRMAHQAVLVSRRCLILIGGDRGCYSVSLGMEWILRAGEWRLMSVQLHGSSRYGVVTTQRTRADPCSSFSPELYLARMSRN